MDPGEKPQAIIRVENFTAAYDGQVVLANLNFEVYAGEVFAILGGSGCGKSTLLKHMIGLYKPAAGRILIDGEDIAAVTGAARLKLLKKVRRHVSERRALRFHDTARKHRAALGRIHRSAAAMRFV